MSAAAVAVACAVLRAMVEQRLPAGRAGGVGRQPLVDTPDVEPVVAPREHPDLLAVGELGETDGAVSSGDVDPGAVHRHGDPAERPLLEPRRRQPGGRLLGGLERQPPPAPQRAPHDGVQPQREDEGAEQRRQDDDHVGVERIAAARVRPGPVGRRVRIGERAQQPASGRRHATLLCGAQREHSAGEGKRCSRQSALFSISSVNAFIDVSASSTRTKHTLRPLCSSLTELPHRPHLGERLIFRRNHLILYWTAFGVIPLLPLDGSGRFQLGGSRRLFSVEEGAHLLDRLPLVPTDGRDVALPVVAIHTSRCCCCCLFSVDPSPHPYEGGGDRRRPRSLQSLLEFTDPYRNHTSDRALLARSVHVSAFLSKRWLAGVVGKEPVLETDALIADLASAVVGKRQHLFAAFHGAPKASASCSGRRTPTSRAAPTRPPPPPPFGSYRLSTQPSHPSLPSTLTRPSTGSPLSTPARPASPAPTIVSCRMRLADHNHMRRKPQLPTTTTIESSPFENTTTNSFEKVIQQSIHLEKACLLCRRLLFYVALSIAELGQTL
ncbi:hypothetical protein GW17_00019222 [Ensete ventricosum]|nr:hypothetical protein GW17_00019222 [Ensete ventricosum]